MMHRIPSGNRAGNGARSSFLPKEPVAAGAAPSFDPFAEVVQRRKPPSEFAAALKAKQFLHNRAIKHRRQWEPKPLTRIGYLSSETDDVLTLKQVAAYQRNLPMRIRNITPLHEEVKRVLWGSMFAFGAAAIFIGALIYAILSGGHS